MNVSLKERFRGLCSSITPQAYLILSIIAVSIYILRVSWVNIMEYNSLYSSNTMLAVNDQLIWYMSKTGRSFSPVYGVNYFFGHFKPILYFFSLLYKIKPGPETLLFTQTLFLGLGGAAVYLIAKKKFVEGFFALVITISYLFIVSLISYTSFHTTTIAVFFFLWSIYFMEKGKAGLCFIFALLVLSCKENLSFLVFMMGLYVLFRKDLKIRKSLGYSLLIASLVWFYLVIYILMPVFARESNTGFLNAVNAIYSYLSPRALVKNFFSFDRIVYILFIFLPFGFLPLLSKVSLIAVPEILLNTLTVNPAQARIFNYYSVPIFAVFFAASLDAVAKRKQLSLYLAVCSFFTLLFFGPSPEYDADIHSKIGREFLKSIPESSSLYSQVGMASHLSRREKFNIYLADYNYNKTRKFSVSDYDYAVLDLKGDKFPDTNPSGGEYFARLKELIDKEGMGLVKKEDGFLLLNRGQGVSKLKNTLTWRDIFIEEDPLALPIIYDGEGIGLRGADFLPEAKQGSLFWLELKFVKLDESPETKKIKIEFKGRRQNKKFDFESEIAHGIFDFSFWNKGEILTHIETVRISPFIWPGTYEIFLSFKEEESQGRAPRKIGEVRIKRRGIL